MRDVTPDRIHIRDLRAQCIIGIYPEERTKKQEVVMNLTLYADLSRAGRSDAIADTIDYKALKKNILAAVEASDFQLIERLAEHIATIALGYGFERVDVTVDKPGALRFARSVAVEISRTRTA